MPPTHQKNLPIFHRPSYPCFMLYKVMFMLWSSFEPFFSSLLIFFILFCVFSLSVNVNELIGLTFHFFTTSYFFSLPLIFFLSFSICNRWLRLKKIISHVIICGVLCAHIFQISKLTLLIEYKHFKGHTHFSFNNM